MVVIPQGRMAGQPLEKHFVHGHRLLESGQVLTATTSTSTHTLIATETVMAAVNSRFKFLLHFGVLLFRQGLLTFRAQRDNLFIRELTQ